MEFYEWKKKTANVLKRRHGINLGDCTDDDSMRAAHASEETPEEFVDYIAVKYDLEEST